MDNEFIEETLPSKTYEIGGGRVKGIIDDYDALKQAVNKILNTERFVFPIYSENYGTDLPDLIGEDFEYIRVEAERMLDEALRSDDRITGVYVDKITKVANDSVLLVGSVETMFGNIDFSKEVGEDE